MKSPRTSNISVATCFPLSWKFVIYALGIIRDTKFHLCSDSPPNALRSIAQQACEGLLPGPSRTRIDRPRTSIDLTQPIPIIGPKLAMSCSESRVGLKGRINGLKEASGGDRGYDILNVIRPIEADLMVRYEDYRRQTYLPIKAVDSEDTLLLLDYLTGRSVNSSPAETFRCIGHFVQAIRQIISHRFVATSLDRGMKVVLTERDRPFR